MWVSIHGDGGGGGGYLKFMYHIKPQTAWEEGRMRGKLCVTGRTNFQHSFNVPKESLGCTSSDTLYVTQVLHMSELLTKGIDHFANVYRLSTNSTLYPYVLKFKLTCIH
jgi:hypothetical protein